MIKIEVVTKLLDSLIINTDIIKMDNDKILRITINNEAIKSCINIIKRYEHGLIDQEYLIEILK